MKHPYAVFLTATSCTLSLSVKPAVSHEQPSTPTGLQVLWSAPINLETVAPAQVGKPNVRPHESGIVLEQSVDHLGQITVLAKQSDLTSSGQVLLEDFGSTGFARVTKIQLQRNQAGSTSCLFDRLFCTRQNANPQPPLIGSMTIDSKNRVWVGGATDYYYGMASDQHSPAYLARLNDAGVPVWQKSYETGAVLFVISMTPISTGNVLIAATHQVFGSCWLAMIAASNGSVLWERPIGDGKGIAVANTANDSIIVANFVATETSSAYDQGVAFQKVTAGGEVGPFTIVRPSINRQRGAGFGNLAVSASDDGAYIASSGEVPFEQNPALFKPAEIAKVDMAWRLLLHRTIPESYVATTDRGGATFCSVPAAVGLPGGNALVACVLKGKIHAYVFNRLTGEDVQDSLPLPNSNDEEHPVALSLFARPNGRVLVSGTRRAEMSVPDAAGSLSSSCRGNSAPIRKLRRKQKSFWFFFFRKRRILFFF